MHRSRCSVLLSNLLSIFRSTNSKIPFIRFIFMYIIFIFLNKKSIFRSFAFGVVEAQGYFFFCSLYFFCGFVYFVLEILKLKLKAQERRTFVVFVIYIMVVSLCWGLMFFFGGRVNAIYHETMKRYRKRCKPRDSL